MSYEYKEKIKEDLEYSLEGVSIDYYSSEELIHKQKVKELDNVYSQAAKADEYEAKAKAFDAICKVYVPLENIDKGLDFAVETEKIILKFYESGEPNAKK